MNTASFTLHGARLEAMGSGALWWPDAGALIVSDLHMGKAERIARRQGNMLPPYEVAETLARLADDIAATGPALVVCLGDSFDDDAAAMAVAPAVSVGLAGLQAGRRWVWIAGNHDPAPPGLPGEVMAVLQFGPLILRHVARPGASGEISGHYHPKAQIDLRGRFLTRRCFLHDANRVILPAYGTYTGGLAWTDPALQALMTPPACAILTGPVPHAVPMPRRSERQTPETKRRRISGEGCGAVRE